MFHINFSDDTGGWSEEGVFLDVENTNSTTITCVTKHLTSFAVLVDTTGAAQVSVENVISVDLSFHCIHNI